MKVGNKILGMAVGQKSIHIAEVSSKGSSYAVSVCAEFVFPEGLSLSTPDKLGHELQKFLKAKQFSTKEVVMGLPAKRLVTRRKEIPAANAATAATVLRVQAEGEFSSELDNLIMDFAGTPSIAEPSTVLLIATNKVLVDECRTMAEAAGLRVAAITSTTAALGRATSRLPGGDGLVLNMGPTGAELVIQHGLLPAHLRHLNMAGGGESVSMLANEIRRTVAAIPRNGTPMTLALWNSSEAENPQSVLEQRLAMPVTMPNVTNLVSTGSQDTRGYAPAVALALSAMESGLAVDFLHSRLAPPKAAGMSLQKRLAILGGIVVVSIVGYGYYDLSNKQADLDNVQASITKQSKPVAIADQQIQRFDAARSW
ncbi:MAG TPA: pilus assembly protein PilM, partial [Phycisphaerae bacterium]